MQEELIPCDECGKATDVAKYASCSCSECKKNFCSTLTNDCFFDYHRKHKDCRGYVLEITNPKWIVNLKNIEGPTHVPEIGWPDKNGGCP